MSLGQELLKAKSLGKTPFIPYITVGDPNLETSEGIALALSKAGAFALELGVPYSDPVADGPTNQRAAERALKNGVTLKCVLGLAARLRDQGFQPPMILFTYFNPILRMGYDQFASLAKSSGVAAVLCVDLPPEEAEDYKVAMDRSGLETIFLASPMTPSSRLPLISRFSTSTVYYVSRTGVTGVAGVAPMGAGMGGAAPANLESEIIRVKSELAQKAVIVGFGISSPAQAQEVARHADGVVIGSAIVDLIEKSGPRCDEAVRRVSEFATSVAKVLGSQSL